MMTLVTFPFDPMKVSTIADVLACADGEGIVCFKGMAAQVGKHYPANPNVKNSQSLQTLTVAGPTSDPAVGQTMKVVLKNQPPFPLDLIGKLIFVTAKKGLKGWSGIKAQDHEDPETKVKNRILWVTSSATITEGCEPEAPKTAQDAPGASGTPSEAEAALAEAVRTCWRAHNAMMMSLRMAEETRKEYTRETGKDLWPDQFRVITSTYFLTLRDGGVVRWLPPRRLMTEEVELIANPTRLEPRPALPESNIDKTTTFKSPVVSEIAKAAEQTGNPADPDDVSW